MGLLTGLLFAPVTLPARGLGWIFKEIYETAEAEMYDPAAIRQELADLQRQFDAGLIGEDSYDEAEARLLARLEAAIEHNASSR